MVFDQFCHMTSSDTSDKNDLPDQSERGLGLTELTELSKWTPNSRSCISKELHSSLQNYGICPVS